MYVRLLLGGSGGRTKAMLWVFFCFFLNNNGYHEGNGHEDEMGRLHFQRRRKVKSDAKPFMFAEEKISGGD